ncbi:proline-specific peptidase [Apiospora phragmitis]|uniref:Proline-specific peptidase n=1 Tax=Apiospora phragmitis TaxID=2905665 RepID=A0ABR1T497_9PEZI
MDEHPVNTSASVMPVVLLPAWFPVSPNAHFTGLYSSWCNTVAGADGVEALSLVVHGGPGAGKEYLLALAELWSQYGLPVVFYDQIGCSAFTHLRQTTCDQAFWHGQATSASKWWPGWRTRKFDTWEEALQEDTMNVGRGGGVGVIGSGSRRSSRSLRLFPLTVPPQLLPPPVRGHECAVGRDVAELALEVRDLGAVAEAHGRERAGLHRGCHGLLDAPAAHAVAAVPAGQGQQVARPLLAGGAAEAGGEGGGWAWAIW